MHPEPCGEGSTSKGIWIVVLDGLHLKDVDSIIRLVNFQSGTVVDTNAFVRRANC